MQRGVIDAVLATRHAGTRKVRLAYELAGDPETPVAFIAGGISADRHVAANAADPSRGWAEGLFDTGRALDPAGCRVLAFDYIGADGGIDALIDTADQADSRRSPRNPRQGHADRRMDRSRCRNRRARSGNQGLGCTRCCGAYAQQAPCSTRVSTAWMGKFHA